MQLNNITIHSDLALMEKAEQIFTNLGIDLSTAINMFFIQVVKNNGLPFSEDMEIPNIETQKAIKEVEEMKKNPHLYKSYTDIDSMMKDLLE